MRNILITIIHPFFYFLVTRVYLPLLYLIYIYFTNFSNNYVFVITLFQIFLFFLFSLLIVKRIYTSSFKIDRTPLNVQNLNNRIYIFLSLIYSLVVILYLNKQIPLFNSGGSQALLFLNESSRISALLLSGITISKLACVTMFFQKRKRLLWILLLIFLSIVTGKKAGILDLVWFITLGSIYYQKYIEIKKINIFLFFNFSIIFAFYQYQKTLGSISFQEFFDYQNFISIPSAFLKIFYFASNVHLIQLFEWGGLDYFLDYSSEVDPFNYFLNPILKLFNIGGVDRTLGTYLTNNLFNTDISIGAPMTLFLETLSVSGLMGGLFGFLISYFLLRIVLNNINRVGLEHIKFTKNSIILLMIPFILSDTLNGYKNFLFIYSLHLAFRLMSNLIVKNFAFPIKEL